MLRFEPNEKVIYNGHTRRPDRGIFLGYDASPSGKCRVRLNVKGFAFVSVRALTKPLAPSDPS